METGNISNRASANISYDVKNMSSTIKNSYVGSGGDSSKVQKDMELNLIMSNFRLQVSSNTYDNLTNQISPKVEAEDDLFGENGYWGIKKTAGRISEFVINGAGNDIEKLKSGREGILRGLKDAEKVWGGTMPDIAYQTIDTSLKSIDEKIKELGGNVVDITA